MSSLSTTRRRSAFCVRGLGLSGPGTLLFGAECFALEDDGEPEETQEAEAFTLATSSTLTGNPYGCKGKSHYPHESTQKPGRGWIQAKSDIECTVAPPLGSEWRMIQILYRSSYWGWIQIAVKYSQCPLKVGKPDCDPTKMRGYVKWQCFRGETFYNYRATTSHRLIVGDQSYTARTAVQTGDWDERGTVQCTNNS